MERRKLPTGIQTFREIGVAFDPRSRNIDAFEVESTQESAP